MKSFDMKKVALILGVMGVIILSSCNKERVCRCSVANSQTIRLIQVDNIKCEDLHFVYYDRNGGLIPSDQNLTDSVLCTDYKFESDTIDILAQ